MADENTPPEGKEAEQEAQKGPQFAIDRIFVKDISLETPKGVEAFSTNWKPRVSLDINTAQKGIGDSRHEVTLRVTVTVRDQESEEVFYLVEIKQAGVFLAKGFNEKDLPRVLATAAPNTLFPYAREIIDSLVVKAGFPPLRLAPINFDALMHAAAKKQQVGVHSETVQ